MYYFQSCYQGLSLRGQGQGQDFFFSMPRPRTQLSQGHHQGLLRVTNLPLQAKICIAVTETEYAYLIKHNAKDMICDGFGVRY